MTISLPSQTLLSYFILESRQARVFPSTENESSRRLAAEVHRYDTGYQDTFLVVTKLEEGQRINNIMKQMNKGFNIHRKLSINNFYYLYRYVIGSIFPIVISLSKHLQSKRLLSS